MSRHGSQRTRRPEYADITVSHACMFTFLKQLTDTCSLRGYEYH